MGYGRVTARRLSEKVPPMYVPVNFSATEAPSTPALAGKFTVKTADLPGSTLNGPCGSGEPVADPSVAVISSTPLAVTGPLLVTVSRA